MRKLRLVWLLILIPVSIAIVSSCRTANTTLTFSGKTMGTTYNVVVVASEATSSDDLGQAIKASLSRVNSHLSNWDPKSEISRFNANQSTSAIVISKMMAKVMAAANKVHRDSLGYFDVTLAPLIELWGFGTKKRLEAFPSEAQIAQARSIVGQNDKLVLDEKAATLAKRDVGVTINLAAIAKGFGVDEVAEVLLEAGYKNFMVEIGGDLRTSGKNARGQKWRIGIERPDQNGPRVQLTVNVSDLGMATSGDYRNYRERNGVRYSHILDTHTGRPVTHGTASVTVLAATAMEADAWATALLALGKERGEALARKHGIAALFIYKAERQAGSSDSPAFSTLMTPRFAAITEAK